MPRKRRLTVAVAIAASVVLGFLCRNISPLPLRISSGRSPAIEASNTLAASFEIAPLLAASRDGDGPVTQDNFSALDKQKSDVEVYVFLSPHCPISNAYVPLLSHLIDEFSRSNFQFFGVIPGAVSDDTDEFRQKFTIRIPLIVDHQNQICEALNATHTPQVVVRTGSETIYSGRIDDRFADLGKSRQKASQQDLKRVLELLRDGLPVLPSKNVPTGCLIERQLKSPVDNGPSSQTATALTFNRDVAPIVYEHCSRCHRPGEAAPFSLMTFDDVRHHASQIEVVVRRRLMPPWKPEAGFAEFANVHRLTNHEIKVLSAWIASDRAEGNPEDLPLTPIFPAGWQLGKPDLELVMSEPFLVPADGPDVYQHFIIPTGLTDNRLVSAVEFRPGAPEVVHHSITYFDTTGRGRELDAEDPQPGYSRLGSPGFAVSGSLGGWGPGGQPRRLPKGLGRPLAKGSDIVLQIHYHPIGRAVSDQSRLGLYFAPSSSTHKTTEIMVADIDLHISAGAARHHHHAELEIPADIIVFDATPHMHVLGKEIKAVAHRPDGTTEPLIWIRDWDFYWQDNYVYRNPVSLPAGTRIELDCWFDNSTNNPLNPNSPPRDVHWGDFSTDEMAICYFQVTTNTWDDYVMLNEHATKYFATLFAEYQNQVNGRKKNSAITKAPSNND